MIMTEFTDKSIKGSTFDFGFGLAYNDSEESVTSVDEENEILVYDRQIFTAGPKVSWHNDPFKLSFSPSVGFLETSAYNDSILMILNEIKTEYTSLFYHNFFPEEFEAELEYENIYYADSYNSTNSVISGFSLKRTVGEKLQFQWNADGGYYSGEEWMALEPGKGMSGSILPDTVYADYFLRSGISLQMAVVDFDWGFVSLPLSYQLGMLDGISGENELFHGPSFGAALYLKKMAFPAVKVNYSYNIESGTGTFSASIGISH